MNNDLKVLICLCAIVVPTVVFMTGELTNWGQSRDGGTTPISVKTLTIKDCPDGVDLNNNKCLKHCPTVVNEGDSPCLLPIKNNTSSEKLWWTDVNGTNTCKIYRYDFSGNGFLSYSYNGVGCNNYQLDKFDKAQYEMDNPPIPPQPPSTDQQILEKLNQMIQTENTTMYAKAIEICKSYGINNNGSYGIFHINDTFEKCVEGFTK